MLSAWAANQWQSYTSVTPTEGASLSAFALTVIEKPPQAEATSPWFDSTERTPELLIGEAKLRAYIPAIDRLRRRAGQQDDLTTDPEYFIAANAMKNRRVTAVLIRRNRELEACVLFFEHCRFGLGLGLCRGGDGIGEGLVAGGQAAFRVHYAQLAARALLQHWRIHGVSLAVLAPIDHCLSVMGPRDPYHRYAARTVAHKLPLESTYGAMLASMGPRTRRSLAGKRRQLETSKQVTYFPSLQFIEAEQAMLSLRSKTQPHRPAGFYRARVNLLRDRSDFFCMGLRLLNGEWLTVVSGWRRHHTTYVDLQMNNTDYKKDSLSAVMRAYLLEYEIAGRQNCIHFVGGTSMLLRRYCTPVEPSTYAFHWRPCLRAALLGWIVPYLKQDCVYERVGRANPPPSERDAIYNCPSLG